MSKAQTQGHINFKFGIRRILNQWWKNKDNLSDLYLPELVWTPHSLFSSSQSGIIGPFLSLRTIMIFFKVSTEGTGTNEGLALCTFLTRMNTMTKIPRETILQICISNSSDSFTNSVTTNFFERKWMLLYTLTVCTW